MTTGPRADWDAELRRAFEILLGQSLDAYDPDAVYALYHWDELLDEEFFRGLEAHALLRDEDRQASDVAELYRPLDKPIGSELGWLRYGIDPGRSVVLVPDEDDDFWPPPELRRAVEVVSVPMAGPGNLALWGTSFGAIVSAHAIDLNALYEDDAYGPNLSVLARVRTDGSLFDAMRAATWTMNGPDRLSPLGEVEVDADAAFDEGPVESPWDEALRAVRHDGLREHLRRLCLTGYWAASEGGHYRGAQCPGAFHGLPSLARRTIAGWEFGQGQAASVILQLR